MSSNQERLKLKPKKRKRTVDSKEIFKEQNISQNTRNVAPTGPKRRLSSEGEVANKRTCQPHPRTPTKPKNEPPVGVSTSKKTLAQNRLTLLRKNLKESAQATSKVENKAASKRTSSNNEISTQTSKLTSYKIPLKKSSVSDRLKSTGESNLNAQRAERKVTVKMKSPEKTKLKRCSDEPSLYTSPLKKKSNTRNIPDSSVVLSRSNTTKLDDKPECSFRLSKEYIVISEASESDSSLDVTPKNPKRTSIKDHFSSIGKLLSPNSIKEKYFKTPLKSPEAKLGLRVPLNRSLFTNKTKTEVQTDIDSSCSPQNQILEKSSSAAEYSKSIFGVQVASNNFQSHKSANIFESYVYSPSNNNILDPSSKNNSIFDTSAYQKNNIFTLTSPSDSQVIIDVYNDKNQLENALESEKAEISQKFSRKPSSSPNKSLNDRLAQIKSEGCNTYRKNTTKYENIPGSSQTIRAEQILGNLPGLSDVPVFGVQSSTFLFDSANSNPVGSRELQTENWLNHCQGASKSIDTTVNDSMIVNVDDSICNKSELPDPIEDVSMDWDEVPQTSETPQPAIPVSPETTKENVICIVSDTNVFMHSLPKIKDIINLKIDGPQKVKIYVPWMVIKELDHLKDHSGGSIKSMALNAERFINRCLIEENSKVIGQTIHDVSQQKDIGKCPDDKILACCMQAVEKYNTVILLTNDINLRNKALINHIETCTPQEIVSRLNLMMSKRVKFCEIRRKLGSLWSMIICDCCKEAYGDVWKKMDMLQNPPWSMLECIKRFKKYWVSVFREILLKQCLKTIDAIHAFLVTHKDEIIDDSEEFNDFMKLILEFLVFLRDIPSHKGSIKKTLNEIIEIANCT